MQQYAGERDTQPLNDAQTVDTRRGNPVDTNNTNTCIIVKTLRHERQYHGEHVLMQRLDGTQAADMRRGNPADAHNTRLKHQSQTLRCKLQLLENQTERAHKAGHPWLELHKALASPRI